MTIKNDFIKIAGSSSVTENPNILEEYSRDNSYTAPRKPQLAVSPKNSNQVISIVKLAREKGLKLVPVSSGPPHFRGDSIPSADGAVIVDMTKMKKIMWINRRNRVALVEPGVTFDRLAKELEKQDMRCMFPLLPRANKSIVGAFMEREPFTVPKYAWDLGDPIASSELILGDGHMMRTGGGAGPGYTLEAQRKVGGAQKLPLSPFGMDVRRIAQGSQGSYAICTWLSLRCELFPEYESAFFAGSDDLEKLINASYRFMYLRLMDEKYILNSLNFACLMEKDPQKIAELEKKLPRWILVTSIGGYGDCAKDQFDYKTADAHEEAEKLGIKLVTEIGGIKESPYRTKVFRKTSEDPYWKIRLKGDCREIFFLTSLSKTPEFIKAANETALRHGFDPADIGVYLQMVIQGTACHCEFDLNMTPDKAPSMEKFYNELSKKIYEMGGYYSRPYGIWSDLVYPGSETFVRYARGLKKIFDPGTVLNPEKLCFKEM